MADELIAGRYRLIEPLGRGAMSAVWLAHDQELEREVAVKTLAPSAERQRFEREARAAAALSHPHICSLYDYGEADGRPFMVLEYLPNGSLEDRLRRGTLPDAETQRIATEVAGGLAHAHERGLVHRDLKPANILFDSEGRAKIADFGIARMGGTGTLTEAGTVLGTASYISPEQAAGLPAGPASDVYSFGVILFRMLTGRLPFVSSNAMELVRMHRDDPPPAVTDVRPDVPPHLEAVTTAALAKDPAARPHDGGALLAALHDNGEGAATMIAPAALAAAGAADETRVMGPAAGPPGRASRRTTIPLAILAALLLAGGGALALALTDGDGGGRAPAASIPGVSLPSVSTARSTPTTAPATTAVAPPTTSTGPATTSTEETTTRPATTTTAPTTTAPATTTTPSTTYVPPTTTYVPPTTTAATTTAATTTAAATTTTAAATTTAPPTTTVAAAG
jgi:serine/threonine-protein kinase